MVWRGDSGWSRHLCLFRKNARRTRREYKPPQVDSQLQPHGNWASLCKSVRSYKRARSGIDRSPSRRIRVPKNLTLGFGQHVDLFLTKRSINDGTALNILYTT